MNEHPVQQETPAVSSTPLEKKELIDQLLKNAQFALTSPEVLEDIFFLSIDQAEELGSDDPDTLCQIARFLFCYATYFKKSNVLLRALDKLIQCHELEAAFLEKEPIWLRLWGNILIVLAIEIKDESFIEKGIQKYLEAKELCLESNPLSGELSWDLAVAWTLLSKYSGEIADLKKGIENYVIALSKFNSLPDLLLEYAESLVAYARLSGDPTALDEAFLLFQKVIGDTYLLGDESFSIYKKAWISYALAAKTRFELSHLVSHLESADKIFSEAALNVYECADLWVSWGELYLYSGLISNQLRDIEVGLEKLTSSKINQCDPLKISALLGEGLITLGHLLEDLKLLREGKQRIEGAFEIAANHAELSFAKALSDLFLGDYFSDEKLFVKAIRQFEQNIKKDSTRIENWWGLYQACMDLGTLKKDPTILKEGVKAISRLTSLRPFSSIYLNEKGIALLRLKEIIASTCRQELIEEAIETFKKGWKLNEDVEILFNLGYALHLLGECTGNEEDYLGAIEVLSRAYEKRPFSLPVRFHLALALSHFGELISDTESLMQAVELFEGISEKEVENDTFFCEYGYALLNLAELVYDPHHPEKGEALRREAEKKLIKSVKLGSGQACYHLACLYSLCQFNETSVQYLQRAQQLKSLPSLEDLEQDEWLECVRKTQAFKDFLTLYKKSSY